MSLQLDMSRLDKNMRHLINMRRVGSRYAVLRGGTRSGKTYAALRFIILNALAGTFRRCSVVAESVPHLRRGALRDCIEIIDKISIPGVVYKQTLKEFHFPGGAVIEFFSADDSARLRGAQRDWLFVNEANLIDERSFNEMDVRTKDFVILDFNPVARFWLNDLFEKLDIDMSTIEVVSTYRDNPYLDPSQVQAIEQRRSLSQWWKTYGEGEYGESQGVAWYNWEVGEVSKELSYDVVGVDFGEGRSPSAVVGVRRVNNDTFEAVELYYGKGSLHDLGDILKRVRTKAIYADSAQIHLINALRSMDIDVRACIKMHLVASFALLNERHFIIDKDSANLIREAREVAWSDRGAGLIKAGVSDHALDAVRYAYHSFFA